MSTTNAVEVIVVDNHSEMAEAMAVAGFLAGYCGASRRSYAMTFACSRAGAMRAT